MTEKLFTGTLNHNQNKTKTIGTFETGNIAMQVATDFTISSPEYSPSLLQDFSQPIASPLGLSVTQPP